MEKLGINLRRARRLKDLSLRELAQKVGVSASFLSQVEQGKVSPSISTLRRIVDALNITIGSLFEDNVSSDMEPVTRKSERRTLELRPGVEMSILTSPDAHKMMEPLFFTLEVGGQSGEQSHFHKGQEFALVLSGTLEITLNSESYVLREGDSIYFDSSIPHWYRNAGQDRVEVVWVVTPPSF